MGWLRAYWVLVDGNIGAIPLEAVVTAGAAWIFRKPIRRAWNRMRAPLHAHIAAEMAELRRMIEVNRRMTADTHYAVTGQEHPDAPERKA